MDAVQKFAECDLFREVYHSDGMGHVQVEVVSDCGFETHALLLEQIEQEKLWPEFFEMVKTREDDWILGITSSFPEDKHYSTMCFAQFLSILTSTDAKIMLLQNAPFWLWDKSNVSLLETVIEIAAKIGESLDNDSIDAEIDLSIVNGVIRRLKLILSR